MVERKSKKKIKKVLHVNVEIPSNSNLRACNILLEQSHADHLSIVYGHLPAYKGRGG